MYDRLHRLSNDDIHTIHQASMEILARVGMAFNCDEALEIFKRHGAKVDDSTVFLSEEMVQKALSTCPEEFTLQARNADKTVRVGGDHFVFTPCYGPPFVIEANGAQRPALFEDFNNLCKLVQTSDVLDITGFLMCDPSDLPGETYHLDMMLSELTLTDKPFMASPLSGQSARESLEMAAMVFGRDYLKENHVTLGLAGPLPPLQLAPEMGEAIIEFAKAGQPIACITLAMPGASAPVTIAGTLAQQNAEILAGITLAQLVGPGTPCVYGASSSPIDMRTGAVAIGSPETAIITDATARMARYYKLPCRSGGGLTDALIGDYQAGMETAINITTALRAGANWVMHTCGILGGFIAVSFEKFIMDEQLLAQVRSMLRPLSLEKESLCIDSIEKVGPGGQFLTQPETFQRCRQEIFSPNLSNRMGHESWHAAGAKRLDQVAGEHLEARLDGYTKPDMDTSLEKDLIAYVEKTKA